MLNPTLRSIKNPERYWILLGIPVLIIAGSLMHFVYAWSGNSTIVGIFAPVNESIWEHLKLAFWPTLIWWLTGYYLLRKNNNVPAKQWFVACTAAIIVCPLVIVSFYYSYTGALGIKSLILDIFSLFIGLAAAQILALHIYAHARVKYKHLLCAIIVIILLAAAFTVFTFNPPHLPLFEDSLTGNYGI